MLLVVKFRNQLHRLNPALQVDTEESCYVRERGKPGMVWRGVWREAGRQNMVRGVNHWSNEDTIATDIVQAFKYPEHSGAWRHRV